MLSMCLKMSVDSSRNRLRIKRQEALIWEITPSRSDPGNHRRRPKRTHFGLCFSIDAKSNRNDVICDASLPARPITICASRPFAASLTRKDMVQLVWQVTQRIGVRSARAAPGKNSKWQSSDNKSVRQPQSEGRMRTVFSPPYLNQPDVINLLTFHGPGPSEPSGFYHNISYHKHVTHWLWVKHNIRRWHDGEKKNGNYNAVVLNAVKREAGTFYCPLEVESSNPKSFPYLWVDCWGRVF